VLFSSRRRRRPDGYHPIILMGLARFDRLSILGVGGDQLDAGSRGNRDATGTEQSG
jgi:hypothetical protein